ncbi:MAG: PQQ-binding-like beta-propeller repeat protein [Acidobacteriota bacterium]
MNSSKVSQMSLRPTVALLVLLASSSALLADAIGWRMAGDGRFPDAEAPVEWSTEKNVIWKTPLEEWSNASPVLLPGKSLVIVLEEPDTVVAVDVSSGDVAWRDALGDVSTARTKAHKANGLTSATPVSDGELIFTVFGSGVVAAHRSDGERLWARGLEKPGHRWGHSASPVLAAGRLVVHVVDLVGLDPTTGEELWRLESEAKWGSPVATRLGDTEVVLTPSGDVVRALDGKRLASDLGNLDYAAPVIQDGVAYFIEKKATAVRLPAADDGVFETLWTSRVEGSRHYASSLVHEGLIYAVSREQKYTVLDASSGQVLLQRTLDLDAESGSNSAYPSITLGGDRIFLGVQNGTTLVLEPGPDYREVARNRLEGFRSTPIFAGNRLFLRAFDHLYCIGG